jgi:hypothetical protein
MALPNPKPLHLVRVSGTVPAVTSAATNTGSLVAPFQGRVVQVGVTIGAAVATADATCTTDINGTAMTGGAITVKQSGSASAVWSGSYGVPTALNTVNENDVGLDLPLALALAWRRCHRRPADRRRGTN